MRGRTNILPRVGGYVTGDSIECEVAETNGIELGDYVQFYQTNVEPSPNKLVSAGTKVKLKNVNGWANFILNSTNAGEMVITELIYEQNGNIATRTHNISLAVASQLLYGHIVLDVGNDNYVILQATYVASSDVRIIGYLFVRTNNDSWTCEQLNQDFSAEAPILLSYLSQTYGTYYRNYAWYLAPKIGDKFLIDGYQTQGSVTTNYIYVAEWDGVNKVVSLTLSTMTYSTNVNTYERVNVLAYDAQIGCFVFTKFASVCCCKLNQDNTVTKINDVAQSNFSICSALPTKVNGKWILFGKGGTNSAYISYCYLYITQEGMSFGGVVATDKIANIFYVNEYQAGKGLIVRYEETSAGSKSPYTYTEIIKAATAVYDEEFDVVNVGELEEIENISYRNSSNQDERVYVYDLSDNVGFFISFYFYTTYSQPYDKGGTKILQIVNDAIRIVQDKIYVKKYQNVVSGVAKTSGNLGDTIQVYIPPVPVNS